MSRLHATGVTIANGATVSTEVDLREFEVLGIVVPAAFTGTAITFQTCGSNDDGVPGDQTFQAVYDGAGVQVSITVAQGHFVALTQAQNFATQALGRTKLVSGSAEGAARALVLITKSLGS